MMKNKLGYVEWAFYERIPTTMKIMQQLGAETMQLDDHGGKKEGYRLLDPELRDAYLEMSARTGISIDSVSGNAFGKSAEIVSEDTSTAAKTLEKYIEICRAFNVKVFMIPFFWRSLLTMDDTEKFKRALAFAKAAGRVANDNDIILAFETPLPAERNLEMLDAANSPNCKIFFDTQNVFTFSGVNAADDLRTLGIENVAMIHLKEGTSKVCGCCEFGTGETDFLESLRTIRDLGYTGPLFMENHYELPPLYESPIPTFDLAKRDMEIVRKAMSSL